MNSKKIWVSSMCLAMAAACLAQAPANQAPAPPVAYSSISELNQLTGNLEQTSQSLQQDLSHLRIERWKTDSNTKRQTQSNVESIARNLQSAMPAILGELKNSPESAALTFKLYRNLDALYDVLSSVVESAGAFGNKEEFQSLSKDLDQLEDSRRSFAARMDKVATAKENEIAQLRTALQNARAEIPPKKVVVDDTEPAPKKPAPRKKAGRPNPPKAQPTQNTTPQPPQQ